MSTRQGAGAGARRRRRLSGVWESLPRSPWVAGSPRSPRAPSGSRAGEGSRCPPLSAVRSRRREPRRGRPPSTRPPRTDDPGGSAGFPAGGWRVPCAGGVSPGGLPVGSPRLCPLALRRAPEAPRRQPAEAFGGLPPPAAGEVGTPSRRWRRRRRSARRSSWRVPATGRGRPVPGLARRCPLLCPPRPSRAKRGGQPGAAGSRSPRGNGESERRPPAQRRLPSCPARARGARSQRVTGGGGGSGRAAGQARWTVPSGGSAGGAPRQPCGLRWSPLVRRGGGGAAEVPAGPSVGAPGGAGCRAAAEARAGPVRRPAAALAERQHPCPERARWAGCAVGRAAASVRRACRARAPGPPPKRARCVFPGGSGARAPRPLPFGVASFPFLPSSLLSVCARTVSGGEAPAVRPLVRPASGERAGGLRGPSSGKKGGRFWRAVPALPRARGGAERQTTLSGGSLGSCVDEERS